MCICVMRVVLAVVNFIFFIIGIIIAAVGGICIWGAPLAQTFLTTIWDSVKSYIGNSVTLNDIITFVFTYASKFGIGLLIIGLVVAGIAFFGFMGACCCCLCCCNKVFLIIYVIGTGAIFLAIVIAIIVLFAGNDQIQSGFKSLVKTTLNSYSGLNSTNAESVIWNMAMYGLSCCGVDNGTDFVSLTTWDRTLRYNGIPILNMTYPYVCCKLDSNFQAKDATCPQTFNTINSNYAVGCFQALNDLISTYGKYVPIAAGVIAAFMLMLIIFAIFIIRDFVKVSPI